MKGASISIGEVRYFRPRVSEEEMLEMAKRGGPVAAALLYDRFADDVNRIVWLVLGADNEHDDLVQQIFCNILEGVHRVRDSEKLAGWVRRVALNIIKSELRKRYVRRAVFSKDFDPEQYAVPSANMMQRAVVQHTYGVIEKLPPNERIVFILRNINGCSLQEIAEDCNVSLATVKRRLVKATRRFHFWAEKDPLLAGRLQGPGGDECD